MSKSGVFNIFNGALCIHLLNIHHHDKKIIDVPDVTINVVHSGKLVLLPPPVVAPSPSSSGLLTNNQLALATYFLLQSLDEGAFHQTDKATMARFLHLVKEKPYSALNNSDLYRKLQQIVQLLGKKSSVKDLKQVYAHFLRVELYHPALLVKQELEKYGEA